MTKKSTRRKSHGPVTPAEAAELLNRMRPFTPAELAEARGPRLPPDARVIAERYIELPHQYQWLIRRLLDELTGRTPPGPLTH